MVGLNKNCDGCGKTLGDAVRYKKGSSQYLCPHCFQSRGRPRGYIAAPMADGPCLVCGVTVPRLKAHINHRGEYVCRRCRFLKTVTSRRRRIIRVARRLLISLVWLAGIASAAYILYAALERMTRVPDPE
jgi:hypothetical protein